MQFNIYESMLSERLRNIDSRSAYSRNFIIGECYGIIRLAMQDPDISFDESATLWDDIALSLQLLSKEDFSKNSELSDNSRAFARTYELCLSAVDDALAEYAMGDELGKYEKGLVDGLIMYCDIYCDCPDELKKLKEKKNKILYKIN